MSAARFRYSIRSRLHWSIFALITSFAALCGLALMSLVFWFEHTLFYNHLSSDFTKYIQAYSAAQMPVTDQQGDTTFYKLRIGDDTGLPELFQAYPDGSYEVMDGAKTYNLFISQSPPWKYVFVQDQSEFERHERLVISAVIIGFCLILVLGLMLSRHITLRVLQPVMALAESVERQSKQLSGRQFNPSYYPNDEIGALAAAIQRYSDKNRALLEREREFTADVSHELRTPLMAIQSASDLLNASADQNPALKRLAARIERSVEAMRNQIELYLQLAREPEAVNQELTTSLLEAAKTAEAPWQSRAARQGIELSIDQSEASDTPQVPPLLTAAVLNNLLHNALNHTEQGQILIKVSRTGLAISDTGRGIDPAIADRIFERGVRSSADAHSSFGIGLSIVKRICDHQGWSISVRPNHPQGTVFAIRISPNSD